MPWPAIWQTLPRRWSGGKTSGTHSYQDIPPSCNQKIANILGVVTVERKISAKANMERKRYMGSWRLCSVEDRNSKRLFPTTATMYMEQLGMEVHVCVHLPALGSRHGVPNVCKVRRTLKRLSSLLCPLILNPEIGWGREKENENEVSGLFYQIKCDSWHCSNLTAFKKDGNKYWFKDDKPNRLHWHETYHDLMRDDAIGIDNENSNNNKHWMGL